MFPHLSVLLLLIENMLHLSDLHPSWGCTSFGELLAEPDGNHHCHD